MAGAAVSSLLVFVCSTLHQGFAVVSGREEQNLSSSLGFYTPLQAPLRQPFLFVARSPTPAIYLPNNRGWRQDCCAHGQSRPSACEAEIKHGTGCGYYCHRTRLGQHENNRASLRPGVERFQRVNPKGLTKITKPNKWGARPIKSLSDFSYPLLTRLLTPLTTRRVASVLKLRHGASSGGPGAV